MSDLYPVAGSHYYMGTAAMSVPNEDLDLTDFASVSWIEVDGWQSMGAIGDSANLISTDLINRARTVKQKGTRNAGSMQNNFAVIAADPGQVALIAAANGNSNWPFKIVFDDDPPPNAHTATVTIASPGVFTWADHGFEVGNRVVFSTTGALPTGLTAGTTYFVKTVPDEDTFTVSTTSGGSAVNTTGGQSGVHTATSVAGGTEKYFLGLVMGAQESGGGANTTRLLQATTEINSNVVTVPPRPAA